MLCIWRAKILKQFDNTKKGGFEVMGEMELTSLRTFVDNKRKNRAFKLEIGVTFLFFFNFVYIQESSLVIYI